jgi:hypothetical protein
VPEGFREEHDCRENHTGRSSKSMEAQGAVNNNLQVARHGLRIDKRILDDDSVTRAWCGPDSVHLPIGLRTQCFGADPTHRIKCWGGFFNKLADISLSGEVPGDPPPPARARARVRCDH